MDDSGNLSFFFGNQIRALNSRVQGIEEWVYGEEVRYHRYFIQEP